LLLENNFLTESCDVQHTDVVTRSLKRYALVNSRDNVIEQFAINSLGQSVPSVMGFVNLQGHPIAIKQFEKLVIEDLALQKKI